MTSNERPEAIDLGRGLPTTAEDVEALHRARSEGVPDLDAFLRFLAQLPLLTYEQLRAKPGPRGEPFRLP
jgi:hypothetical protein